jgi:hypothetical protein
MPKATVMKDNTRMNVVEDRELQEISVVDNIQSIPKDRPFWAKSECTTHSLFAKRLLQCIDAPPERSKGMLKETHAIFVGLRQLNMC